MKTDIMMSRVIKNSELKRFMVKAAFLKSVLVKSALVHRTLVKSAMVNSAMVNRTLVKSTMVKSTMVIAALVIMASCGKIEKPEIVSFELGYENSKTAYVGGDLHMNAEIVAEGRIDVIRIEIHPEGDHGTKGVRSVLDEGEWEVDTTYARYSGLKNTTFHDDIEIPADAETGHYHFYFEVTDMEGYQTVYEEEFELLVPETK